MNFNKEELNKQIIKLKIFDIKKIMKNSKLKRTLKLSQWTQEEDQLLLTVQTVHKKNKWKIISKYFPNKKLNEVMLRYYKINPLIKKGKWTLEEDRKLLKPVSMFGRNWALISKVLKNRNHKQVRSRYTHFFVKRREINCKKIQKLEEYIKMH